MVEGMAPSEWPPSPEGIEAAERLATAAVFDDVCAIASSPERKALATAEPLARRLRLQISIEHDLREVERPRGTIVPPEEVAGWVHRYLDGCALDGWEPPTVASRRIRTCVDRLQHDVEGTLVIVSHGLLLTLYREDSAGLWKTMPLPAVAIADDTGISRWQSVDELTPAS